MRMDGIVVVTITLARSRSEEGILLRALDELMRAGRPVIAADGGSRREFIKQARELGITLVQPGRNGLVPQVKTAIKAALKHWPERMILYTEPDKRLFFRGKLAECVGCVQPRIHFGVGVVGRDERSFKTFPKGQQWTERFMNEAAALGWKSEAGDYCYGPLLMSRRAAEMALQAPEELGWGWRFYTMGKALEAGLKLKMLAMNLPCPTEQRREDTRADRLYRLKQLRQNLEALARVTKG